MKTFFGIIVFIDLGVFAWYLDKGLGFKEPALFWGLGGLSMFIVLMIMAIEEH